MAAVRTGQKFWQHAWLFGTKLTCDVGRVLFGQGFGRFISLKLNLLKFGFESTEIDPSGLIRGYL